MAHSFQVNVDALFSILVQFSEEDNESSRLSRRSLQIDRFLLVDHYFRVTLVLLDLPVDRVVLAETILDCLVDLVARSAQVVLGDLRGLGLLGHPVLVRVHQVGRDLLDCRSSRGDLGVLVGLEGIHNQSRVCFLDFQVVPGGLFVQLLPLVQGVLVDNRSRNRWQRVVVRLGHLSLAARLVLYCHLVLDCRLRLGIREVQHVQLHMSSHRLILGMNLHRKRRHKMELVCKIEQLVYRIVVVGRLERLAVDRLELLELSHSRHLLRHRLNIRLSVEHIRLELVERNIRHV